MCACCCQPKPPSSLFLLLHSLYSVSADGCSVRRRPTRTLCAARRRLRGQLVITATHTVASRLFRGCGCEGMLGRGTHVPHGCGARGAPMQQPEAHRAVADPHHSDTAVSSLLAHPHTHAP
eukprot:COSAG01_NODE_4981_length_4573_cov_2.672105_1_plen_121_part_00